MSKTLRIDPDELSKVRHLFERWLTSIGSVRAVEALEAIVRAEVVYALTAGKAPKELTNEDIKEIARARGGLLDTYIWLAG